MRFLDYTGLIPYFMQRYLLYFFILTFTIISCYSTKYENDRGYLKAGSNALVHLPFEEYRKLIIVKASVNGTPGEFVLDNGFTLSAVNKEFAEKAGIKFNSFTTANDAHNRKVKLPETTVKNVNIGGHEFHKTGFYMVDTRKFFPCKDIDGVIGASIINKINWKIDFENKTISLNPRPFREKGIKVQISFSRNNNTNINLRIKEREFSAKVDLGKTKRLQLRYKDFKNAFTGDSVIQYAGIHSSSVSGLGKVDTFHYLTDQYSLYYKNQPLANARNVTLSPGLKYPAYLGIEWFKDYILIINSTEKEYILQPIKIPDSPKMEPQYGITIYPVKNTYRIIKKDVNAIFAGAFNLMEEVTYIDDMPVSDFENVCDYKSYMKEKHEKGGVLWIRTKGSSNKMGFSLEVPRRTILK